MSIKQIMSKPVDPIDPTTTVAAAAKKMRDEDVGCLLVGRNNQLFGIFTDRDIAVRAFADGRNRAREPIWTVMSNEVLCCLEDQPVEEAARIMEEHSVRRLPVLDGHGFLSGIVSLSDVYGGGTGKKPWQVTFYRNLTDSRGKVHETPLTKVYVTGVESEDEAAAAARRIVKKEWCLSQRKDAADGFRVDGGTGPRLSKPRRRPFVVESAVAMPSAALHLECSQVAQAPADRM